MREILDTLGYKLIDNGDNWRTSAKYRGGGNPTSVIIYKNTGVWRDFGVGENSFPFTKLVELSGGGVDFAEALAVYDTFYTPPEDLMDKVYPLSSLDTLFPNYHFYKQRNISEETQKLYRCGLSSFGKMYRRITFPIFNDAGQICGWSGRAIDKAANIPKWKHLGKKRNWVYPYYVNPQFLEYAHDSQNIYLVESIGDSLALTENGILNHLVLFGVSMSSKILSKLIEINPQRIIISLNNDYHKDFNTGLFGSIKIYLNLLSFFPSDRLSIYPPFLNDFGEMQEKVVDPEMHIFSCHLNPDLEVLNNVTQASIEGCSFLLKTNPHALSVQHQKQLKKLCNE